MLSYLISFLSVGFVSVLTQSVLIRLAFFLFQGNELTYGIVASSWLFWNGIGAYLGKKIPERYFSELFLLSGIIIPLITALSLSIKSFLGINAFEMLDLYHIVILTFLIFLPPAFLTGVMFNMGTKIWARIKGKYTGIRWVYILDALGDFTGGIVFSFLFIRFGTMFSNLLIVSLFLIVVSLFISKRFKAECFIHFILIFSIIFILVKGISAKIEYKLTQTNFPGYALSKVVETPYNRIILCKKRGIYSIFSNGALMGNYFTPVIAEKVHIATALTRHLKNILILGAPLSGEIDELKKYKGVNKYIIEKDNAFFFIYSQIRKTQKGKDEHWIFTDPVYYLKTQPRKFDLIYYSIGNPINGTITRLYTKKFFKILQRHLAGNGIIFLSISSNENYLSSSMSEYNASILNTIKTSFPFTIILPGEKLSIIAAEKPIKWQPYKMCERLKQWGIKTTFINPYYLSMLYLPERVDYINRKIKNFPNILNTRLKPISYWFDNILWSQKYSIRFRNMYKNLRNVPLWGVFLFFFGLIIFLPGKDIIFTGIIGGSGIVFEIISVLIFQLSSGNIFYLVGAIIGSFMLGVSFGAYLKDKIHLHNLRKVGIFASAYILIFSFLIIWITNITGNIILNTFIISLSNFGMGGWIGFVYPLVSSQLIKSGYAVGSASGITYWADLIGASVSSILCSTWFIPIYGIIPTILIFTGLLITISILTK